MANGKIMPKLCALIVVALLASGSVHTENTAYADNTTVSGRECLNQAVTLYENLCNSEIEIPEELSDTDLDETFLKAVVMGYANMEDEEKIDSSTEISKQDFMAMLYKTIINYDASYTMSEEEADSILNECYDNAYIKDENRTAYAFMMKQGIITTNYGTNPDKPITWESCSILIDLVNDYFTQDTAIQVGSNEIIISSNVDNLIEVMGEPNRIDKSEYGFDWYVYNSNYSDFCMIGVEGSRVCAVFANGSSFGYEDLESGCDFALTEKYSDLSKFTFFETADGRLDAIMYNPRDKGEEQTNELKQARASELLDIINANRSKNIKTIYAADSSLSNEAWLTTMAYMDGEPVNTDAVIESDYDIYMIYNRLVLSENDIITKNTSFVSPIGVNVEYDGAYDITATLICGTGSVASLTESETVSFETFDRELNEVETVTTPILISPTAENVYNGGDDVVIELAQQASTEYHIEVFDVESDEYAVNEYIKTDSTEITLPSELFTEGCDYKIIVSSVTPDGTALSAEEVSISYGSVYDTGIEILTPEEESATDDDYMKVTWVSDAYSDFSIDLYNEDGELIASTVLENEYEALIQGLDPGKYYLYVTALRRGTIVEKAQDYVFFEIQNAEPVINEIILEPDDVYYFVYEDEALGVIYLYDEELVTVEENGESVVKKKIIQKQVKATKAYRALAEKQSQIEMTTGDPVITRRAATEYSSDIGEAIVQEAEKYLGVDYVWGGTSPSGFDCSGLVQYCLNSLGISISRVAEDQFEEGTPVSKDELQPGDLVFFEQNGYIHHVGIYVGNNMMIHAPQTGDVVKYQSIDTEYYRNEYAGARRVY
ncbi:MAG: NlpC/P60 family protein [Oscillospiraceae bacterium]|nr:NlpC/P60 family protein [Oscillospiraceae bacterium]